VSPAWWMTPLAELRHHWSGAYNIEYFRGPDLWLAQRRDTRETLKAATADELLELIRADYAARPVPRAGGLAC
jgi:hypothetical protein